MRTLLVAAVLALVSGTATAQTPVNNPSAVAFTASVDHDVIWTPAPGQPGTAGPVLTNYLLEIDENGAPVRTTDLGKPTPSSTRQISVPLTQTGLQQNHTYMVVVVAVGPGGNTRSDPAGPFGWFVTVPVIPPAPPTNVTLLAQLPPTPPATGITVGGRVMAGPLGCLVRPAPTMSAASDIVQPAGALGTVIGGPVFADNITWWNVNWDTGTDGWGSEGANFLIKAP